VSGFERRLERVERLLAPRLAPYQPPDDATEVPPMPQRGENAAWDNFCRTLEAAGWPADGTTPPPPDKGPPDGTLAPGGPVTAP
jgi:hypothetical protein